MKSLLKSLDVLEYILNREGLPVTPAELSESYDLPPATAVRILQVLTERAYLKKISRHAGYAPGPVIYALSDRRCFYGCAVHAATEVLKMLAIRLDIQVNLSVLEGTKRYILYHYSADQMHLVCRRTYHESDFFTTATGRVLLAYAPEETQKAVSEKLAFPKDLPDKKSLQKAFVQIRKKGSTEFLLPGSVPQHYFGAAVRAENSPVCAIGTQVNANRDTSLFAEAFRQAAEEIEENILLQKKSY